MPGKLIGPPRILSHTKWWMAAALLPLVIYGEAQTGSALEIDSPRVTIEPRARVQPQPRAQGSDIRVDVNVVLIPVTVTDPLGRPVLGLSSDAFHLSEDGIDQPLAHLVKQDAPLSIGFVFDASKSMESKLDKSREAISQLMRFSTAGDEYFLVNFNDSPRLLSGFTRDTQDIENALLEIQPMGWTALLDAIHLSVNHMKRARNSRRVLVVLSDGGDNNSRYNEREIRELLRESNVSLYAIGILGKMVTAGAVKLLSSLAEDTGGRLFPVHNLRQLPEAAEELNAAVRDQYVLAYYPSNSKRDGKYRRVQVKVAAPANVPSVHASWRLGYYAPE